MFEVGQTPYFIAAISNSSTDSRHKIFPELHY